MKHAILGVCLCAAACGQPLSPSAPSIAGAGGAQNQAKGGANVVVTFTKWVPAFPALAGVTGGDVPGTFAGEVLHRDPFDNGNIVQLEALYQVIGQDSAHSFIAHIEGKQNNETQQAVFNGTIIEGWLLGARVHVTYDVIVPPAGASCIPQAPVNKNCFQGTIRVMPGSAD